MRKNVFRKILCVLLACAFVCAGVFPAFATTPAEDAHLHFDKDGRFRILNFSDFQDGKELDARVKTFIRQAMETAKPDLVVLTGDNIYGKYVHGFNETRAAIAEFMDIFEALGVPVAIVFGNHDDEGDAVLKDDQLEDIYSKYSVNISYDADVRLDGCGTYNVPIYGSSETDKVKFNLWMFDTGSSINYPFAKKYDYMRENQLQWYVDKSNQLTEENGGEVVPSIAFQHIIVNEIYKALVKVGSEYVLPSTAKTGSVMHENPTPSGSSCEKEFSTLKQQGDVIAVVSGHDHCNMFVVPYNGIDLINTPSAGFYENYFYQGDSDTRGARIIDVYEPGVSQKAERYSTEMLLLSNYPQPPQSFYLPTGTGKYVHKIALATAETKDYGGSTNAAMAAAYGKLYSAVDAENGNGVALWADLNAGSDILDREPDSHTVICMGYTRTNDPDKAMRRLGLCYGGNCTGYDDTTTDGLLWNLCCYHDLAVSGTNSSLSRCNLNAGTEGNPIYFFAGYDTSSGSPLTEIRIVNTGRNNPIDMSAYPDYQLAYAVFGSETGPDVADLNKSAWGDYIYALYKTADHALSRVGLNTQPLQDARFQAMHRLKDPETIYPEDCLAKLQAAAAKADAILCDLQDNNTTSVYDQAAIDAATYQIMAWLHIQQLKNASRAFTVTFDANGGTCNEQSRTFLCGTAVGELPIASKVLTGNGDLFPNMKPIRLRFDGWFTEREGGEQITSATVFAAASDQTWYAHWSNPLDDLVIGQKHDPVIGDAVESKHEALPGDDLSHDHQKYIPADVNSDGTLDLKDLTLLTRYLAGGWNVEADLTYADVNADGNVDLRDVVLLRRYFAGGWNVVLA